MTWCNLIGTNISEELASIFVAEIEVADSYEILAATYTTTWYQNPEHKTAVKTLNLTIFVPQKSVLKPYEQTSFLSVSTIQQICMMCSEWSAVFSMFIFYLVLCIMSNEVTLS